MTDRGDDREKAVPPRDSPYKELSLAARKFLVAARKDPTLKVLLLVDPIHALADAGIPLSRRARKLLRRTHPEAAYDNDALYEGVRSGSIKLPWIERVELRTFRSVEGQAE